MADSDNSTSVPDAETATVIPFTPKEKPPLRLSLDEIPFFGDRKKSGRDFWAIDPPDDYADACEYGADLAIALLRYDTDDPEKRDFKQILRWVAIAQAERGLVAPGDKGALVGFWGVIGEVTQIMASPEVADVLDDMNKKQRNYVKKYFAEQKAERSRRARHAALAGIEKRRKRREAMAEA